MFIRQNADFILAQMVKRCIRGLMFVPRMLPLKKPILSRFVFSPKPKLISAKKNYKFRKEVEVDDI
jgi:hypothetical protein